MIKQIRVNKKKGFTLIELIVVIAILAILVLLALPRSIGLTEKATQAQIKNDVKVTTNAINEYLMTHNKLSRDWFVKEGLEVDLADGRVYGLHGMVNEVKETEYQLISPDFINEKTSSNLTGDFIANNEGDTYYIDKTGVEEGTPH